MQSVFESVFGEDCDELGGELPGDGGDATGMFVSATITVRSVNVFNVRASAPTSGQWIPTGAVPTVVELLMNVQTTVTAGAESWDIKRYGTLGDDPNADVGLTAFGRCTSGTTYVSATTNYRTTGAKTNDLGATAVTDALDRVQTGGTVWGVSIKQVAETKDGTSNGTVFDEYTNGTAANRPRLRVTWKAVRDPVACCGMVPGVRL